MSTFRNHTPEESKSNLECQKKVFLKAREASFFASRILSVDFQDMLCIYEKHFIRSKESVDIIVGTTRHIQVDSREEKVTFVDFQKLTLQKSQNRILSVQKSFFEKHMGLQFWLVQYFLWIFKACYAYEKHFSRSKESFDIIFGITRHIPVDSREERVSFVDFSKSHSRRAKI